MKMAGLLLFITDIHSLGLQEHRRPAVHHQLVLGPERRDAQVCGKRFFDKTKRMPTDSGG
jgi:hypothetical protein